MSYACTVAKRSLVSVDTGESGNYARSHIAQCASRTCVFARLFGQGIVSLKTGIDRQSRDSFQMPSILNTHIGCSQT